MASVTAADNSAAILRRAADKELGHGQEADFAAFFPGQGFGVGLADQPIEPTDAVGQHFQQAFGGDAILAGHGRDRLDALVDFGKAIRIEIEPVAVAAHGVERFVKLDAGAAEQAPARRQAGRRGSPCRRLQGRSAFELGNQRVLAVGEAINDFGAAFDQAGGVGQPGLLLVGWAHSSGSRPGSRSSTTCQPRSSRSRSVEDAPSSAASRARRRADHAR